MIEGDDAILQSEAQFVLDCSGGSNTSEMSVFYCAAEGEPWEEVHGASFDSVNNTASVDVFGLGAYVASDSAPTQEMDWPDDTVTPDGQETEGYVDLALSRSDNGPARNEAPRQQLLLLHLGHQATRMADRKIHKLSNHPNRSPAAIMPSVLHNAPAMEIQQYSTMKISKG